MPKKQEKEVTLVFENGAYRVVDIIERTDLLAKKSIVFERVALDKGIMAYFYRRLTS